jgi:tetratricopeptide (TPR) repeat protein
MLGVSYLSMNKFERAAACLNLVINQSPTYKKNLFLLLAICYKKLDKIVKALECISGAFDHYPDYLDAYIYRAKLHMKLKQYSEALSDFNAVLAYEPNNVVTLLSRSDCLKIMGRLLEAAEGYS